MKEQSEKRVDRAVNVLLQTLTGNVNDTGIILEEFENYHDDAECESSKAYLALVAGHFALKEAIDEINKKLNKE